MVVEYPKCEWVDEDGKRCENDSTHGFTDGKNYCQEHVIRKMLGLGL